MRIFVKSIVAVAAITVLACQSPALQRVPSGTESSNRKAEQIGRAIFEKDLVAAKATDALFRAGIAQTETRVRGWISVRQNGGWVVSFVGILSGEYFALHDVKFQGGPNLKPKVISFDPPAPLIPEQRKIFLAKRTAMAAVSTPCPARYNSVVLHGDAAGSDGWVVYLLAATTTPGEIMVGGHYRVEIAPSGSEVRKVTALSKSCLRIPPEPDKAMAAYVTHVLSDTPAETHVFLSLVHRKPLYVGTKLGVWRVSNGKIEFANAPQ